MTTSSPPVSSATRSPQPGGITRSSSPWMASTGVVMRAHQPSTVSRFGYDAADSAPSTAPVVSRAQPTASSICFVECRSLKHCPKKNQRKSSYRVSQYSRLYFAQCSPGSVPSAVTRDGSSSGAGPDSDMCAARTGSRGASGTAGPTTMVPCTREACSAASSSAQLPARDSPTTTARSVPVASRTASAYPTCAAWSYAAGVSGRWDCPLPGPS
jgi:hypothetical protein